MQSERAPVALFVYNRPDHTRQTVEALKRNRLAEESDLYVFSDAPKSDEAQASVASVRDYLRTIDGFRSVSIVERERNWGVDPSVIDGVTMLCERFGRVVVLEDDLVTSPWFLTYMNRALDLYRDDERVMQVSGFMFPLEGFDETSASFLTYATCWGWATWARAWTRFDAKAEAFQALRDDPARRRAFDINNSYDYFNLLEHYVDGKLDAWDIRWYLTIFSLGGLALFPHKSLVLNIGLDGSGVHGDTSGVDHAPLVHREIDGFPRIPEKDTALWKAIEVFLSKKKQASRKSFVRRILSKVAG